VDNTKRSEITLRTESEKSIPQIAASSSSPLSSPPQEALPPQEEVRVNLSMMLPLHTDSIEENIAKKRKTRPNFSPQIVHILKEWLTANKLKPFPTKNEKSELCDQTGLTIRQLNIKSFFNFFQFFVEINWFV